MNELIFNWRKHLNIKKVIIFICLIISIITLICFSVTSEKESKTNTTESNIYNQETNSITFFDTNKTISLELSNEYNLKSYTSLENYLIELRSDSDLNIFVSSREKIESKSFKDVVSADRLAFTESFNTVSNISELKEITINENNACTYSFHYLDTNLNTTFYIQVSWIEIDNIYYIFDIEFPLNDLNNYVNIVTDTLYSFKKI